MPINYSIYFRGCGVPFFTVTVGVAVELEDRLPCMRGAPVEFGLAVCRCGCPLTKMGRKCNNTSEDYVTGLTNQPAVDVCLENFKERPSTLGANLLTRAKDY